MTPWPKTISTLKYLVFLSIAFGACGDDETATDTGTADTSAPADAETSDADTSAPDTAQPETTPDTTGQPDTTGGSGITTDPAAVQTTAIDGHSRTVVDASSSAHWTHLSLFTGALSVPAPAGDDAFHLGLQRYLVKLGDGVAVLTLDGVDFAALTTAPAEGEWKVDGGTPETAAISDWWTYDGQNHVLSAKPDRLYVVKADERAFKVRFRDYYDQAGSPGTVTFDWAEIDAPEMPRE